MKIIALVTLIAAPMSSYAAIDLPVFAEVPGSAGDGVYLNPDLSSVNETYTLQLGFMDMTLNDINGLDSSARSAYLGDLDTHFSSFAEFNFTVNGLLLGDSNSTYNGSIPTGASAGDRVYTYVTDALNTVHGLFTSDNGGAAWTLPNDPGNRAIFLTAGTPQALIGSIDDGANGVLQVVPEPSTYAFAAGLMTLGLVAYRRRQRA